jgi:hypothetical protein
MTRSRDPGQLAQDLERHLTEATRRFSGDDITLGLIWFARAPDAPK